MSGAEPLDRLGDIPLRSQAIRVGGIELHYVDAGAADAPPVVLLHGFPEFWFGWRHQIPVLVEAGFRVIAVDQRGYNRSGKPAGPAAYDLDLLAGDVLGLAAHLGIDKLNIVGHDWGASVAWWLATTHADRLAKMAVINAPHPTLWRRAMRANPAQRRKSWYVCMLALPWLPELAMRSGNFKALGQSLVDSSLPGTFPESDLATYRGAWAQPGALSAMIHWYRALLRKRMPPTLAPIDVETLMIWGVDDKFGERSVAAESIQLCRRGRAEYIEDATHWVHHERAEHVNRLLVAFLRS